MCFVFRWVREGEGGVEKRRECLLRLAPSATAFPAFQRSKVSPGDRIAVRGRAAPPQNLRPPVHAIMRNAIMCVCGWVDSGRARASPLLQNVGHPSWVVSLALSLSGLLGRVPLVRKQVPSVPLASPHSLRSTHHSRSHLTASPSTHCSLPALRLSRCGPLLPKLIVVRVVEVLGALLLLCCCCAC